MSDANSSLYPYPHPPNSNTQPQFHPYPPPPPLYEALHIPYPSHTSLPHQLLPVGCPLPNAIQPFLEKPLLVAGNLTHASSMSNSYLGLNVHTKKPKPKKNPMKMSQSVRCEICDIYCNSIELYEKHLAGKKHLKTLKKKYAPLTTPVQPTSQTVVNNSTSGLTHDVTESPIQGATSAPMGEDHLAGKRHRNQGVAITTTSEHGMEGSSSTAVDEDLDAKKQKVMECGAVEGSVDVCSSGNAVCISDVASADHIVGEKHILQGMEFSAHGLAPAWFAGCGVPYVGATTSAMGGHNNSEPLNMFPGKDLGAKKQKLIRCGVAEVSVHVCTMCNIVCNSEVVYADHIVGKRHIAQVQKAAAAAGCDSILSQQIPLIPQKPVEDIEAKRLKIQGSPAAGVRVCAMCNVVCNSDSVFSSHLAGQKHASMVKKMAQTQTSMDPVVGASNVV